MTLQASIHVNTDKIIGEVDDYLYGANLEHIGQSVYGGIWAEMLRDRKFAGHDLMYTGASEGLDNVNPNIGVVVPWEAVNPDYQNVLFVHDNTTFYTGRQSQRITIHQADSIAHGIQQSGLYLEAHADYEIRIVLKGEGQSVTITLGDATWQLSEVGDAWQTYTLTLGVESTHTNGAFAITTEDAGNLWVGCASVMPATHLQGFRADVVAALRDWQPTFLRWPGGNFVSAYHWEDGIGDRDKQAIYPDPAWHQWESHDMGTDEFLILCQLVGCDALLTVNMGNGTAQEAAAWVEYCNGSSDTPYGKLRAENGHPEPYDLKTWFVGNEQFGNWQVGHVDAETYAYKYLAFADAMRQKDNDLELIAVGVPTDLYAHWNQRVLEIAGDEIDQLSVHYYSIRTEKLENPPSPEYLYLPKIAASYEVEQMLDATLDVMQHATNNTIPIAFDEWNTYCGAKSPDFIEDYNLADAVYAGGLMNACLKRCDYIKMSAVFNLINVMGSYRVYPQYTWQAINLGRGGAWVATAISGETKPQTVKMPATLVMELMTSHRGEIAIDCKVDTPVMNSPSLGTLPAFSDVPIVDAAITYKQDEGIYYLSVINRSVEHAVHIDLTGIENIASMTQYSVKGDSPLSTNTPENKDNIRIIQSDVEQDALKIAPHSFHMFKITLMIDA